MKQDPKPPSRTADQFVVRLPDGMRDRIKEAAVKNGRSANAEIVHRLEQSIASDESIAEAEREVRSWEEKRAAQTQDEQVAEWTGNVTRINDQIGHLLARQKLYLRLIEKQRQSDPTKESK